MRCSRVRKALMPYHDGELTLSRRSQVTEHLLACSTCSAILGDLERADTAANVPDPGADYWSSFTRRVVDGVGEPHPAHRPSIRLMDLAWFGRALRYAPLLSAALVLVVAAGLLVDVDIRIRVPFQKTAAQESAAAIDDVRAFDRDEEPARPEAFADSGRVEPVLKRPGDIVRPVGAVEVRTDSTAKGRLAEPAAGGYTVRNNILEMLDKNLAGGELVLIQVLNYSSRGDVTELRALKTDLTRSGLADRSLLLRDTVSSAGDPDLTSLLNDLASALRDLENAPSKDMSGVQTRIRRSGLLERTADYRLMLASEEVIGK